MPVPYTIRYAGVAFAEPIQGEFSDEEWPLLALYLAEAERLRTTEFVRSREQQAIRIELRSGVAPEVSGLPSRPVLAELLHTLRPFILQDERASFVKVVAMMGRREPDPRFRSFLKSLRGLFEGERDRERLRCFVLKEMPGGADPFELIRKATPLNSDKYLRLWLNGFEYHREEAKRRELEDLCGAGPTDLTLSALVPMLGCKVHAILAFADGLRRITTNATEQGWSTLPLNEAEECGAAPQRSS